MKYFKILKNISAELRNLEIKTSIPGKLSVQDQQWAKLMLPTATATATTNTITNNNEKML